MAKKYIPVSGRAPPLTDSDQGALLDLSSDAEWPALSSSTENSAEASDLKFPSSLAASQGNEGMPGIKRQFEVIRKEEQTKKHERSSLMMTVAAIFKHHHNKPSSSSDDEYHLLVDGYVSVLLVTETVAKILGMDKAIRNKLQPKEGEVTISTYFKEFLRMNQHDPDIYSLPTARIIVGIRHSLAHANTEYILEPRRFISQSEVRKVHLYRRDQLKDDAEYTKVHSCKPEEFTSMCTILRELFLNWDRAAEYIPRQASQPQKMEQENASWGKAMMSEHENVSEPIQESRKKH